VTPKREIIASLVVGCAAPLLALGISDPPTTFDKVRVVATGVVGLASFAMLVHGIWRLP